MNKMNQIRMKKKPNELERTNIKMKKKTKNDYWWNKWNVNQFIYISIIKEKAYLGSPDTGRFCYRTHRAGYLAADHVAPPKQSLARRWVDASRLDTLILAENIKEE